MTKPVLYVSLDGPILIPSLDQQDTFLQRGIAGYAKPFMHWAKEHFDVRWLAETGPRDAFYTSNRLKLPDDSIRVASFTHSKHEAINPNEAYYWLDASLTPPEIAFLEHHRHEDRLIPVDPHVGVTQRHQKLLAQKIQRRAYGT